MDLYKDDDYYIDDYAMAYNEQQIEEQRAKNKAAKMARNISEDEVCVERIMPQQTHNTGTLTSDENTTIVASLASGSTLVATEVMPVASAVVRRQPTEAVVLVSATGKSKSSNSLSMEGGKRYLCMGIVALLLVLGAIMGGSMAVAKAFFSTKDETLPVPPSVQSMVPSAPPQSDSREVPSSAPVAAGNDIGGGSIPGVGPTGTEEIDGDDEDQSRTSSSPSTVIFPAQAPALVVTPTNAPVVGAQESMPTMAPSPANDPTVFVAPTMQPVAEIAETPTVRPIVSPTPPPTTTPTPPPTTSQTPPPTAGSVTPPVTTPSPNMPPTPPPSTPGPTPNPTNRPTVKATNPPTENPTPNPTRFPTPNPTNRPTRRPTDEPTPDPTEEPTPDPTKEPTEDPTAEPSPEPTFEPTPRPTNPPTPQPTRNPTRSPTPRPTRSPTPEPTPRPTLAAPSDPCQPIANQIVTCYTNAYGAGAGALQALTCSQCFGNCRDPVCSTIASSLASLDSLFCDMVGQECGSQCSVCATELKRTAACTVFGHQGSVSSC